MDIMILLTYIRYSFLQNLTCNIDLKTPAAIHNMTDCVFDMRGKQIVPHNVYDKEVSLFSAIDVTNYLCFKEL